jgi:hypothetical protein
MLARWTTDRGGQRRILLVATNTPGVRPWRNDATGQQYHRSALERAGRARIWEFRPLSIDGPTVTQCHGWGPALDALHAKTRALLDATGTDWRDHRAETLANLGDLWGKLSEALQRLDTGHDEQGLRAEELERECFAAVIEA